MVPVVHMWEAILWEVYYGASVYTRLMSSKTLGGCVRNIRVSALAFRIQSDFHARSMSIATRGKSSQDFKVSLIRVSAAGRAGP